MVIDVSIENILHLREILAEPTVDGIFLPGDRLPSGEWKKTAEDIHRCGKRAFLALPAVFRLETGLYFDRKRDLLERAGFDGWLLRSLDEVAWIAEEKLPGERILDAGLYVWNRESERVLLSLGADVMTLPYEYRAEECRALGYRDRELVVYGRIPVMVSAQCTARTEGKCRGRGKRSAESAQKSGFRSLRDRRGAVFPEDAHCRFCYSVVYNSVPLWLLDCIPDACERIRFAFTDEKKGGAARILRKYAEGERKPTGDFTRGHFTRGVE